MVSRATGPKESRAYFMSSCSQIPGLFANRPILEQRLSRAARGEGAGRGACATRANARDRSATKRARMARLFACAGLMAARPPALGAWTRGRLAWIGPTRRSEKETSETDKERQGTIPWRGILRTGAPPPGCRMFFRIRYCGQVCPRNVGADQSSRRAPPHRSLPRRFPCRPQYRSR